MAVKFADEIVKEIQARGSIMVPEGYVTGEEFENWLYYEEEIHFEISDNMNMCKGNAIMPASVGLNFFLESYGEAA